MREYSIPLGSGDGRIVIRFPGGPASPPRGALGAGREDGAFAVLSLRESGDMRYAELDGGEAARRAAFFGSLGLGSTGLLAAELFHTRRVLWEDGEGRRLYGPEPARPGNEVLPPPGSHDGILLAPGSSAEAACITVADCMPIWLLDRSMGVFGVLHSGWKGTGILEVALSAILANGGRPESVSVILGPAIGTCCYDVDEGRARAFAAEFGEEAAPFRDGRHRLDLRAANRAIARRLGVGDLLSVEACTACEPRLGSFRREGPASFTRMAAVAMRGVPR